MSSFIIDKTFEYRIDDNEIICDEFFYYSLWDGTGRVKNQKRRTLEIDIDYYNNIIVKGEFVINKFAPIVTGKMIKSIFNNKQLHK